MTNMPTEKLVRSIINHRNRLFEVHAKSLISFPDEFSNWQGTGQNVARDIAKGEAGKFDAQKLVGHWFNQILYFDSEGVKSFGFVENRAV